MSKHSIPSLEEILELLADMKAFDVNDYIIKTADGKQKLDLSEFKKNQSIIPLIGFSVEQEKGFVEFEFSNGQVVSLNKETEDWVVKNKSKSDTLYLIRSSEGAIKIGITNDIQSRLSALQTSSPSELTLLYSWKHNNPIKAEKHFHKYFASKHIRGEWFSLNSDDVEYIVEWFRKYVDGQTKEIRD